MTPEESRQQPLRCPDIKWCSVDQGVKAVYGINCTPARLANTHTILAFPMHRYVDEMQKKGVNIPEGMLPCAEALSSGSNYLVALLGRAD